ncbi:GNAT family N-acetyltransferase [Streptomyces diastaticus]|uniref:GNAT family N-acetyltransferase n=1 Tax=Streptomyces TaxID=1883 RepID=UPI000F54E478|nr:MULTISPECIES: GNAT family N-acetyltransferase [unclassified Streptomyces]NEE23858.1 GNAT family N-acetyltransferase [Streptomyces sp. SID7982]NEE49244.1 GNAT family N-acetyltransferase [Streptomyces sp. SID8455]
MSTPALSALPVRPLTLRDLPACTSLAYDRGWSPDEHKWRLLLAAGHGVGVDAPDGGGLLGACTLTDFGPHEAPTFTAIGMMLIADRYARQGFGRRLLEHVIRYSGSVPLTLYASAGAVPLYRKLGFSSVGQAAKATGRFTGPASSPARPGLSLSPARAGDLPRILRLDAEVFGTDRTPLITRLPAFADRLLVAEEGGELTGFAARWPSTGSEVVGPLVARDGDTARALITALAVGSHRPLRVDVDVRHTALLDWLGGSGMPVTEVSDLMTRDLPALPGDWTRRFAPLTVAAA